jgi:hypothetical protein
LKGTIYPVRVNTMEDTLISLATGLISVLMVVMVFQICILL